MVRAVDRSVGRITQALEDEGLSDNTIVVFSSDNGGAGYIGLPGVNAPFRGWKLTNFEGGLRVPMFIKWPKKIAPGVRAKPPVAHIDLMPTLAKAAGAGLPADVEIDGVDILPLASDPDGANWAPRHAFLAKRLLPSSATSRLEAPNIGKPKKAWLFNLAEDPTEQNNLAEREPVKLNELRSLLAQHAAGAREPLHPSVVEMPVAVDKTRAERVVPGDEFIYWPN